MKSSQLILYKEAFGVSSKINVNTLCSQCRIITHSGAYNNWVLLEIIYRVIHKSVKHFKNSQQIDYVKDHGNSSSIKRETVEVFFKEKPVHIVALICR